ncbi:hypothetical protein [Nostoc sp.]|uniref:hypothetical protein n=1 Tax=Nostoc sp. TaxID=1180 RepID=UPI002FF5F24F
MLEKFLVHLQLVKISIFGVAIALIQVTGLMRSQSLFFLIHQLFHLLVKLAICDRHQVQTQHLPKSHYHHNDQS